MYVSFNNSAFGCCFCLVLEWSARIKVQNCLYSSLLFLGVFVCIGIWQSVLRLGAWRFVQQVMERQRNRIQQEALLGATFTSGYMCVRYAYVMN